MSDLLERLRRAAKSAQEGDSLGRFAVAGKIVVCPHCGNDEFDAGTVLLNTTVLTLLDVDWADRRASILNCRRCGRIEWFSRSPDRPPVDEHRAAKG